MYVCEKCHETDIGVTQCNFTFKIHLTLIDPDDLIVRPCEVCGKMAKCLFCDSYQAEIITRAHLLKYNYKGK